MKKKPVKKVKPLITDKELFELEELIDQQKAYEARSSFKKFCEYIDSSFFNYSTKPHLIEIADAMQEVADGITTKLAISLPPRAGKSYITSMFCSWVLGNNPNGSVMRNSYAAKLAEKFSKDLRDGIMINARYRKVFPEVRTIAGQIDNWNINENTQPSYFCAGVGGAITGFGVKTVAILDDPIKNIEEALSETVIENVWNWYTSTHLSRLESGCPEIHIATRWSRKDPIGRLTDPESEAYSRDMKVIKVSALNDKGESFCEEVKTTQEYLDIKQITEDFIWEAEFQQSPVEAKGLLFPIEQLRRFKMSELPTRKPDAILGAVDTADKGDDDLSAPIERMYGEDHYVVDVVFSKDPVEITEPLIADLIMRNKVEICDIEANNGGSQYARNIRNLIKNRHECSVISETNSSNKETRILVNSGFIKQNYLFRSDYAPGSDYDRFMRSLCNYMKMGKNKHDDAPDSITMLAERSRNMKPPSPRKKQHFDHFEKPDHRNDFYNGE